ncbi:MULTISPECIES: SGNH/GDSL hydrolase family protein [Streptomyces]|uniref:Lysophospholipase L1-like esterase n=1 Tax=Streptomyces nymphaeiformis TaxID=2663842 RepID=A0A7W7TX54_9ACTN|nr:SGNH/GDSL hydrolase family protein [Streptomyces nymphaeiformis]MBB4980961.1 lysophospholipase L1-like esterase [Streptomyces nymphaeiformis]
MRKSRTFGMPRTRVRALAAVLAALTTTALGLTTTDPAHAAPATGVHYVALGDSYSAGGGSSTTYLNDCNQSVNSYPYLYNQLTAPASFDFQACGAAKTTDVLDKQLAPLGDTTTLVSMTIGGNDIGLGTVMATCLFGSDSACLDAIATAETTAHAELPGKLDAVYDAIRTRAPQARVVILGYPRFYDLDVPACPGISATKRTALNKGADVLNSVIRDEVAQHSGFVYEDVADRFTGHQLCDGTPWLHALNWPIGQSFHPNAAGQSGAYLPALQNAA